MAVFNVCNWYRNTEYIAGCLENVANICIEVLLIIKTSLDLFVMSVNLHTFS